MMHTITKTTPTDWIATAPLKILEPSPLKTTSGPAHPHHHRFPTQLPRNTKEKNNGLIPINPPLQPRLPRPARQRRSMQSGYFRSRRGPLSGSRRLY
jgi:hypothetical protein